jgi:hypothetical protein
MKVTRVIVLAAVIAASGVGFTQAKSLRNADQPAEFPPSSYKGTQYVDSRGCAYVRAGISGDVTWIPRVTRARAQVCDQTPSIAGAVGTKVATAALPNKPVQITLDATQTATAKVGTAAVVAAKPTMRQPLVAMPKPARVTTQRPASVRKPAIVASAAVTRGDHRPTPAYAGTSASGTNGATRIIPLHLFDKHQKTQKLRVPKGYRPVWSDDRLNPNRAVQTTTGYARTQLVWTQTVPRRLISVASGRDVTATVPLVYPYIDMATQTRELGVVSIVKRNGQAAKRIVRNLFSTNVRQPVVSSRSATVVKSKKPKAAAAQLIQVGTFDRQDSAQKVAKRIQRMGLPVRIGKFTRSGKTYRMVLAGPFGSDATQALAQLRAAGYRNAALR